MSDFGSSISDLKFGIEDPVSGKYNIEFYTAVQNPNPIAIGLKIRNPK